MGNATSTGKQLDDPGVSKFIIYADFNCPFCYALNERLHELNREDQVEFRTVQHAPSITSSQSSFEVLSALSTEVAEVRRRAPSTQINVPMFRPNSGPASQLVNAISRDYPRKAIQLRRLIFRALWVNGGDISKPDLLDSLLAKLDIDRLLAAPDCGLMMLGRRLAMAKLKNMCAAAEAVDWH